MRRLFTYTFLLLGICAQTVFAQVDSSTFYIRVYGGSDNTPPTTPTLLSVSPIAATQIDVSWSASTDDIAFGGYSIFRDGTPIATTTLLSYSDSSLSPSTTYAYAVRAFDTSYNYSTTSNTLATTTPDVPPPPTPEPVATSTSASQGTVARVAVDDLRIIPGVSTTSIEIDTARPARIEVRWGRSASYELGYVVSSVYTKEYAILLTDLEPGTTYEYEIVGYTQHGQETVISRGVFTTQNLTRSQVPANVRHFEAIRHGDDVELYWENPPHTDLAQVRIVRSHLGFPLYPQNGAVVYQGKQTGATDVGILKQYSPVYYTAFVYDIYGNVSSGAVAVVYGISNVGSEVGDQTILPGDEAIVVGKEATSTIEAERVTVDMVLPEITDLQIEQNGERHYFGDPELLLQKDLPFTVLVPKAAVAGNLKSIIATVVDPTNNHNVYSFLLRINHDQTAYETVVPPFGVSGQSQLVVQIFDYEAFVVATYQTPIWFGELPTVTRAIVFPDILFVHPWWLVGIVSFLLFLIILLLIILLRRRNHEEDEDND